MEEDGGLTWTPSPCDTCVRQRGQTVFTMAPVVSSVTYPERFTVRSPFGSGASVHQGPGPPSRILQRQRHLSVNGLAPTSRGQVEDVIRSESELAKRDPHDVYIEVRRNEISLGREQATEDARNVT